MGCGKCHDGGGREEFVVWDLAIVNGVWVIGVPLFYGARPFGHAPPIYHHTVSGCTVHHCITSPVILNCCSPGNVGTALADVGGAILALYRAAEVRVFQI